MKRLGMLACGGWFVTGLSAQQLLEEAPLLDGSLPVLPQDVRMLAAGDVDGDGDDDLVWTSGTTTKLMRRVAGGWSEEPLVAGAREFVYIGDIDGDQIADVAIASNSGLIYQYLDIYWGDGSGQFPAGAPTSVLTPAFAGLFGKMIVADVDGDGDCDLVHVPGPAGAPVTALLRNNGNRTFQQAPPGQFPAIPAADLTPVFADVDGDGAPEVLFLSRTTRSRLFWNNGGNFVDATTVQFPVVQQSITCAAVADFDGDTDLDVVLGGDNAAGLLLRTVADRQLAIDAAPFGGAHTLGLFAGDADGDLDADVWAFTREQTVLWRNDGGGAFQVGGRFGGVEGAGLLVRLDLDGNGHDDFFRPLPVSSTVSLTAPVTAAYQVTPGRLSFVAAARLAHSVTLLGSAGDVDGDGLLDVLTQITETGLTPSVTWQVSHNRGDGVFAHRGEPRTTPLTDAAFVDLDDDGLLDCVRISDPPLVFANVGGELAVTGTPVPMTIVGTPRAIAGLDFDGDGDRDLLVFVQAGSLSVLRAMRNDGGSWVDVTASRVSHTPMNGYGHAVTCADFDGDGDDDVWLHTWYEERVLRNVGGVLTEVPGAVAINGWGQSNGSIGDLDGDGTLDLQVGRYVMLNAGNCTFTVHTDRVPNLVELNGLNRAIDLDDDGDLDLVGGGQAAWNDGNAVFAQALDVWPTGATSGTWTDVDRDGDVDYVANVGTRRTVFVNKLRQLTLAEPVRPGGAMVLTFEARSGEQATSLAVWMALSFAEIAPTFVPGFGWLMVDPLQAGLVGGALLASGAGQVVHQEPVPPSSALLGAYLTVQPLELRGDRLRLGNQVETIVR